MQIKKWFGVTVLCVLFAKAGLSQQLRLGNNPWSVEKSAVLELQSTNQGLLFTRIADTAVINALTPPDGMVIYFTPLKQLMLRTNGAWRSLVTPGNFSAGAGIAYNSVTGVISNTGVLSVNGNTGALTMDTGYISNFYQKVRGLFAGTAPITYANGLIGITQASSTTNGYLSSADWNMFNNKLGNIDTTNIPNFYVKVRSLFNATGPISYLNGNISISQASSSTNGYLSSTDWTTFNNKLSTVDTTNIANFYVKVRSLFNATGPINYVNGNISIPQANATTNGYLSSTDWNNFNNKLANIDTGSIPNFSYKVRGLFGAGTGISYNPSTGVMSNTGVLSLNGNTGALTMDTGYIANFNQKVRGLFNATGPINYLNGNISITQASATTSGYLSSTDWNTFNNKLANIDTGSITNFYVKVRSLFNATGPISYLNGNISISQANASTNGYLSSTDWTTFNNKLSTVDTTNISNFYVKVRSLFNATGPINYVNGNISIPQANATTNGYLSSTDWNNFNNKLANIDTGSIPNFSYKVRSLHSAGTGLTYNPSNGAFSNAGVLSVNGNIGALTMDTGYIANFNQKVRGLFNATGPINYLNGNISITQASATTSGFLSSTDWNTFNNKLANIDTGSIANFYVKVRSLFNATGPISYLNGNISISQANASTNGYLSSTDWTTFNNKLSTVDTTNIANFSIKVRSLFNATGPVTYSNGNVGITQATTSTNGYLSSTDWNTFNNKLSTVDTTNIANFSYKVRGLFSAGSGITYNPSTGAISTSGASTGWVYNGNTVGSTRTFGTIDAFDLPFITTNTERMRITAAGRVGVGVTNPTNPLVVKDTLEIRRVGSLSTLLFSNTSGSGDFRIGGDGGDIFWQGGGGRNLQMGSYWTTILGGDRQNGTFPSFTNGGTVSNTGVLVLSQRDASVPLAIQAASASQTANLTEWRNASATTLALVDETGSAAFGTSTFDASNPEKLLVDAGTTSSFNVISGKGSINNYLQLNIQNRSSGNTASADVVATSDNGTESANYVDLGINSSGFSNTTYPVIGGANNAYLYSTGNDFVIGNATASKNLRFFTGGYTAAAERMRIDGSGNVGIGTGTATPSTTLHIKSTTSGDAGLRLENLTTASATTSGAAVLGVDGTGKVVRAKTPVYYTGTGTATVDGITKVWLADVANTNTGIVSVTIPTNIGFTSILGVTVTAKSGAGVAGTNATNAPVAVITNITTTTVNIYVMESRTSGILIGGNAEGMDPHTDVNTRLYIRVEGN